MGDWSYTQWSSLQEVAIQFENPAQQPNPAVEEFQWDDTSFWSLGAEYDAQRPVDPPRRLRARTSRRRTMKRAPRACPTPTAHWLSIGATWAPSEHWEINAGYTRIETDDPTVNLAPSLATSGSTLVGTYDANVNLWGLSGQYRF